MGVRGAGRNGDGTALARVFVRSLPNGADALALQQNSGGRPAPRSDGHAGPAAVGFEANAFGLYDMTFSEPIARLQGGDPHVLLLRASTVLTTISLMSDDGALGVFSKST